MSILGSIASVAIPAAINYFGQRSTNRSNQSIAANANLFNERMSSTAYQRSMADMKKAGLNPILAYKQGGASAPTATTIPEQNEVASGINSALAAKRLSEDIKLMQAEISNKKSSTELNKTMETNAHMLRIGYNINNQSSLADAKLNIHLKKIYEDWIKTPAGLKAAQANIIGNQLNPMINSAKSASQITR